MPSVASGMTPMYTSAFDCFKKTFVNEGIRGFYKGKYFLNCKNWRRWDTWSIYSLNVLGMAAPTMMVTPNYAVLFFSYGLGKTGINKLMPGEMTPAKLFLAGAFSGAMYTFTICPVERIKCLLQVTHLWYILSKTHFLCELNSTDSIRQNSWSRTNFIFWTMGLCKTINKNRWNF